MNTILVSSQIVHKCLGHCQEYELSSSFEVMLSCKWEF